MAITSIAPLTQVLWSDMADIYAKVVAHPFITGLCDGTLARESFQHYIVQDAHYLRGYARVLSICAARAENAADTVMFAQHAAGAVAAERDLHSSLLIEMGTTLEAAAEEPVAPTTNAYLNYLFATAYGGSFPEALGAVLPCYWLYAKVAATLGAHACPNPLYARWIDAYSAGAFQGVVDEVLAVVDRIGPNLSSQELRQVRDHLVVAARYEWMFWDAGYRRERWPI